MVVWYSENCGSGTNCGTNFVGWVATYYKTIKKQKLNNTDTKT